MFYYPLLPDIGQYFTYGLKTNINTIDDNWFGFGIPNVFKYYTMEILQTYLESTEDNPYALEPNYFGIYLLEHETEQHMERFVQTLFVLLSDLGGFLEIIIFLTTFIVYYIQTFYFE